jgi:hypothetical protein
MTDTTKRHGAASFAAHYLEAAAEEVRALRRLVTPPGAEELERLEALLRVWCGRLEQMGAEGER